MPQSAIAIINVGTMTILGISYRIYRREQIINQIKEARNLFSVGAFIRFHGYFEVY